MVCFLCLPDFLVSLLPCLSSEEFPSLVLWHDVEKLELRGFVCFVNLSYLKVRAYQTVALLHFGGVVAF